MATGDLRGFHHFYAGIMIALLCFVFGWQVDLMGKLGILLGVLIILDDYLQHFWAVNTPLRRLNNWLWRNFALYQWLCSFVDRLLGKRR